MGNPFSRPTRRPSQPVLRLDNISANTTAIPEGVPVAEAESITAVLHDANAEQLALRVSAEKAAIAAGAEQSLLAMLSIKAPVSSQEVKRPPIDLVACIDRSGSMGGKKMELMKQTLTLLVTRAGFTENDRLSLVTFDRGVTLDCGLTAMDKDGRDKAEGIVKGLRPGSTTNLSGGTLKAIDVLEESAGGGGFSLFGKGKTASGGAKRTRAVMVFTDGLANEGIRQTDQIVAAVSRALSEASTKCGGPIALYTFGFGADHNESCLRTLASNSSGGLYYFVDSAEDIPNAFADCLGGLTSVVVQNAELKLEVDAQHGVSIKRVLGSTYSRNGDGAIVLGDLFSEDEKDVLIELSLPKLPAPAGPSAVLRAALRAFNVARGANDTVEATLEISRPAKTPTDQQVNTALDAQRNRILAAETMEQASRLADNGDLAGGREMLRVACRRIEESASAGDTLSAGLAAQCIDLSNEYVSSERYRSIGSKMSKMHAASNYQQRSNHMSANMYSSGAKRKASMKMAWSSSLRGNNSDSD